MLAASGGAPLTEAETAAAVRLACREVGMDDEKAELIRLGHNAIYRLSESPVVVRVARQPNHWALAEREVCIAGWLADVGVPAVRLWETLRQPIEALERPVTFWEALPPAGDTTTGDLGRLLVALHSVSTDPPCDLQTFDPLINAETRARNATTVPGSLTTFVLEQCDILRREFAELEFRLPKGVIHGDAYRGNVLRRNDQPVLIDFETFAHGPREWDLIPTAIAHRRLGLPGEAWDQFVDAYGFNVETWPGFEVLARMREIMMTSWLMQLVEDHDSVLYELQIRIKSIEEGDSGRRWQAF